MLNFKASVASAILTFGLFMGGTTFAQTDLTLQDEEPESNNNTESNTITSNSGVEPNNDTENNTVTSNSGLEQMTIKAQLKKSSGFALADYAIKKFRFSASNGSEICPSNDCEYRVQNGQFSDYLGSGYLLEGKLKVTIPEDDTRKSIFKNFRFELDKKGEEESHGEKVQILEGRYGIGSELTYDITNATLQLGKNPVLTMHGERTPSENFTNKNTEVVSQE
jgi:hypothetical protein